MSQDFSIVGLAFADEQLWLARQNGLVESPDQPIGRQLEADPVGLVSHQGQIWLWGQSWLTRINGQGQVVQRQAARPCHSLCQRGELVWTASEHEICCYQLSNGLWELVRQFSQLKGGCLSFDVSSKGDSFLRIWPGQGNRWHLATYDACSGELKSEFKRGALWLQAVFSPNDFNLMVTGWSPQQVTAISFSGGSSSDRHRLVSCAWAGPILHFDQRIVVICQGGLQSYDCLSFPQGRPEYSWSDGYQGGTPWVIPVDSKWKNHHWYPRYANRCHPKVEYARCPVTAVATDGSRIAVGHQDGSLRLHHVFESTVIPASIPVRALGHSPDSLLLLNPREKQLLEIPVSPGQSQDPSKPGRSQTLAPSQIPSGTYPAVSGGTYPAVSGGTYPAVSSALELDDYWPHSASEWGQIVACPDNRLLLRDRYATQLFDRQNGRLLWKHERSDWSLATRLLAWKDRLYLDQASRGLAWLDPQDGQLTQLDLDPSWNQGRLRLYPLADKFLLQSQLGAASRWGFYQPDQPVTELKLCPSWCDAAVSSCQGYISLSRHQIPHDQRGNILVLDSSGQELTRWQLPWCGQAQAEPSLQLLLGVQIQSLVVYDFDGQLVRRFQGHGSAIVGFRVDCQTGWLLSWDENGWVRRWSLA